jgi:pilus assembly protein CpaF
MTNIPPIPAKLEDGRLLPSMEGNLKPNLENGDYSDNNVGNKRNSVIGVDGFDGEYTAPGNPLDSFTPQVRIAAQALLDLIADDESSEVLMNGPNEIGRKVKGARYHCPNIFFDNAETYHDVINKVILPFVDTKDSIDGNTVVLEGQLELPSPTNRAPMLARVHIIAPPGVTYAKVTIAKKPRVDLTLDNLADNGTLSQDEADFIKACARGRMTIVISGPTGSGKTTLLQAITHHFDQNDRIVVIEETPELRLSLGDVIYLRATLERPGMDMDNYFSLEFWTKQANRMRMDRVIVGETRGAEMAEWLLAANSGAEGSATTVHANSARRALDKILSLATKSHTATSEKQLRREIAATINIIVQVGLVDGRHVVTEIEEISDTISATNEQIQTNKIFEYDRTLLKHVVRMRPSDEFINQLNERGVSLNRAWFKVG